MTLLVCTLSVTDRIDQQLITAYLSSQVCKKCVCCSPSNKEDLSMCSSDWIQLMFYVTVAYFTMTVM